MNADLRATLPPCAACRQPIEARIYFKGDDGAALCTRCASRPGTHARLWPDCRAKGCTAYGHLTSWSSPRGRPPDDAA